MAQSQGECSHSQSYIDYAELARRTCATLPFRPPAACYETHGPAGREPPRKNAYLHEHGFSAAGCPTARRSAVTPAAIRPIQNPNLETHFPKATPLVYQKEVTESNHISLATGCAWPTPISSPAGKYRVRTNWREDVQRG